METLGGGLGMLSASMKVAAAAVARRPISLLLRWSRWSVLSVWVELWCCGQGGCLGIGGGVVLTGQVLSKYGNGIMVG